MDKKLLFEKFKNWSANHTFSLADLFPEINKTKAYHIDLSTKNKTVKSEAEFNNPHFFSNQLRKIQKKNPTQIITGGYLEQRALYTSDIYNAQNSLEKRNIHLGVDFWLPENTPVHALFKGEVVCAVHQKSYKGYGGFIIVKHQVDAIEFYSLYGHLSKESVEKHHRKSLIEKGSRIGFLGNYEENGAWVPHLHFQIMLSLLDYKNDFPGVALKSEIEFWKTICPNPNLLFKLSSF